MIQFLYDGTFEGLLCTIHRGLREMPESISPEEQSQSLLFAENTIVETSGKAADAMASQIRTDVSGKAFTNILHVYLSEIPQLEMAVLQYVRAGLQRGAGIDQWHANPDVKIVHDAARKTTHEIHRLKGLLRFRELENGMLWAPTEPDHNVILPLALHFRKRLPAEQFIIHDLRRGLAMQWDGRRVESIIPPQDVADTLSVQEDTIQQLWKTYIRSATIAERKNSAAQKRQMPRRYWKWLTETTAW